MSLVSHYCLADDEKWYREPVVGVAGRWYICFDDDDPPELVVRRMRIDKVVQLISEPDALITQFNLPFELRGKNSASGRCFPRTDGKFHPNKMFESVSWWLHQTGPIPSKLIVVNDGGPYDNPPRDQSVLYAGNDVMAAKFLKELRVR